MELVVAKVSCRALAHLLMHEQRGVVLDDAARQIAADARELGRLLRSYDEQHGTDRDTALAVAFPSADQDKSPMTLPAEPLRNTVNFPTPWSGTA